MLDENKYDQCFNNTLEKNYFETEKTFTTTNKSNNDKQMRKSGGLIVSVGFF